MYFETFFTKTFCQLVPKWVFLITVSLMLILIFFTTSSKVTNFPLGRRISKLTLSILQYVFMPLAPEKAVVIIRTWFCSIKKDVGVEPLLVPRTEAFALPDIVERATQKPTPICTDTPFHRVPVRALRTQNPVKRMRIYTSRRHLPLPCP